MAGRDRSTTTHAEQIAGPSGNATHREREGGEGLGDAKNKTRT
jgi:hypothetical protein